MYCFARLLPPPMLLMQRLQSQYFPSSFMGQKMVSVVRAPSLRFFRQADWLDHVRINFCLSSLNRRRLQDPRPQEPTQRLTPAQPI